MKDSESKSSGGLGFFSALTLLFVALKLMGYIQWSWLWVLSPLWIPLLIVLALMAVCFTLALITNETKGM